MPGLYVWCGRPSTKCLGWRAWCWNLCFLYAVGRAAFLFTRGTVRTCLERVVSLGLWRDQGISGRGHLFALKPVTLISVHWGLMWASAKFLLWLHDLPSSGESMLHCRRRRYWCIFCLTNFPSSCCERLQYILVSCCVFPDKFTAWLPLVPPMSCPLVLSAACCCQDIIVLPLLTSNTPVSPSYAVFVPAVTAIQSLQLGYRCTSFGLLFLYILSFCFVLVLLLL